MSEQKQRRPGGRGAFGPGPLGGLVEKPKDFKGTFRRLAHYLAPEKHRFIAVFFLAIASTLFSILGPKVMGKATTKLAEGVLARYEAAGRIQAAMAAHQPESVIEALKRQPVPAFDMAYVGRILLVMLGLYVISGLFGYLMGFIMSGVSQNTVYRMRSEMKEKLDRLPLRYFDQRTHGEILSRTTNDMDTIAASLQQSLSQLITSVVTVAGILVMMLTISPLMTLIALVSLPASALITLLITRTSQRRFKEQQQCLGRLNGHVEEMFSGHKVVKAFGREADSVRAFQEINEELYHVGWKAQFMSGIIFPALNFVSNLGYVAVCVVGGVMVARKAIEVGDIQAFIQYIRQFTHPIIQVANIANVLQSTVAAAERVFEVLDEPEQEPESAEPAVLTRPRGEVRFEGVRFGYTEGSLLMTDLSFDVRAGDTIAIVGPTGAGKTTLVNLLMRFYELQGGRITIDGTDIRTLRRSDLRQLFGMVLQDTWLFGGTLRDNIACGREGATETEIVAAARAAQAHHFIRTLPEGYDTVLNEEASNISQGQKQLLTIARAVLADPAILILDEATSNVDTRTELLIQKAMQSLMRGRTSFVIAHRLSTIRDADHILVMNQGAIIEQGTHHTLLAAGGFYADLYNSQFTGRSADSA